METLLSTKFLSFPNSCSSALSPFTFTHLLFHRKPSWAPRKSFPCLASPSSSSSSSDPNFINYGGWDDLDSFNPSPRSGKLDPLQNLLISVGIDGKKHFFLFLLGYISALSISRFKSLSWVVFPASVFIFVAGFWVGIVRSVTEYPPNKIPSKEQGRIAVSVERMKDLISDLEIRVSCLRTGIEGTVKSNVVDMSEIRNYLDSIESFRLAILPVKNLLGELVDNDSENFCYDQMVKSNEYAGFFGIGSKNGIECDLGPSRRKRDVGLDGFDFKQFLRIFLRENLMSSHPQKSKVDRDGVPSELQKVKMEKVSEQENGIENPNLAVENNRVFVDPKHENMVTIGIEKKDSNWISENEPENIKLGYLPNAYQCQKPKEDEHNKNLRKASTQATQPLEGAGSETEVSVLGNQAGNGARAWQSEILAGTDIKISQEKRKKIANLLINNGHVVGLNPRIKGEQFSHSVHERYDYDILSYKEDFDMDNRSAMLSSRQRYLGNLDHENENKFQLPENDKSIVDHRGAASDIEDDDTSLFSTISDDEKFSKHLKEGSHLLKRARECLIGQGDEEMAEMILYKSARLFSRATAMRPASLLAVGQLGNTLLLHGELKLKISQELRTLLSRNDSLIDKKGYKVRFRGLNNRVLPKDKVASVLVDVCEECEELLVEAGRKYRMALSIDGDDVRALYNWGLALSFRARLIADIGPEAAYDADKVYLAAIDKFNAMMSRSNAYTPDALFRWGVALQQRSHLRPNTSKEKAKLLQQARRLFEDALSMESGNIQVREALSSCLAELNYRHF